MNFSSSSLANKLANPWQLNQPAKQPSIAAATKSTRKVRLILRMRRSERMWQLSAVARHSRPNKL